MSDNCQGGGGGSGEGGYSGSGGWASNPIPPANEADGGASGDRAVPTADLGVDGGGGGGDDAGEPWTRVQFSVVPPDEGTGEGKVKLWNGR